MSLVKPVCAAGTTLITTTAANGTSSIYYCQKTTIAGASDPLVTCTYYVGLNETKTVDSTHTAKFCSTVRSQQTSWKSCTVSVSGKTVTAVHSVAYCASHKPKTNSKPAETKKAVVINNPSLCPSSQRTKTIRPGDSGNCVAYLQSRLPKVGIDGVYDKAGKTRNAVEQKQRDAKLKADGVVGPCTWKYLNRQSLSGCKLTSTPSNATKATFTNGTCTFQGVKRDPLKNTDQKTCDQAAKEVSCKWYEANLNDTGPQQPFGVTSNVEWRTPGTAVSTDCGSLVNAGPKLGQCVRTGGRDNIGAFSVESTKQWCDNKTGGTWTQSPTGNPHHLGPQ